KTILFLIILPLYIYSQSSDECFDCHNDEELEFSRGDKAVSLYVNPENYHSSIHADMDCIDCHTDFDSEEIPHREGENIASVECSDCHETDDFNESVHGLVNVDCFSCHTKHSIQEASYLDNISTELCINCHNNPSVRAYKKSIHYTLLNEGNKELECKACHGGSAHTVNSADFTEEDLHTVCSKCHEETVNNYEKSLHGLALTHGKYLAPNCITCHGQHAAMASTNPNSQTFKMNIPQLCGDCHKDGTRVSELKNIDQKHVLENYSQSIHGDGLFRRGLIVTAVCTDCHKSHNILPHQNPESSINRNNIAATCAECHAQIEAVHVKVIEGELWEKEPHKIPACIDCHQPHVVRRVVYEDKYTDNYCMSCHIDKDLHKEKDGEQVSLFIDYESLRNSAHKENSCIKCHTNIDVSKRPICIDSGPVDCSACHAEQVSNYEQSYHGKLFAVKDKDAPYCNDCHYKHATKAKLDPTSRTFRKNIPQLCASCHREGEKAAEKYAGDQHEIIKSYNMSIHGKGLIESGLTVTAICTDCHTSHLELPATDPLSSINSKNIPETCSKCHFGIYEQFQTSVHSTEVSKTDKRLPNCYDCHKSHSIERVERGDFRQGIIDQCGTCHEEVTETYFETLHGKVSRLGEVAAAKCYDCHGSHNILPPINPNSTLSRQNVIETCKSCHPNSNKKFVGYLTHATHHDQDKYPYLYYTFWAMTTLLVGTFTFFGIHTLLWFPRALKEKKKHQANKQKNNEDDENK
ncbi:MAG: cytochrome c3 family protein, partial [Melioribacteraceae bacterium]|nr:cytochrome c3 family protein [Melioribacteraceae bacterium]